MRDYDYSEKWKRLLTPDIVTMLAQIHECKGEQKFFIKRKADILSQLMEIARIQSIEASNKIEGIQTSDDRLKKLVSDKTRPRTRNEEEIAGYRDVLNMIHENYDHIPPKTSIILQLYKELYKFEGYNIGNRFKSDEIELLCWRFQEAMDTEKIDSLFLIPMFVLDFLCIHPFINGNGRMSRLLTLLLLYRSGYVVGKYNSIEKIMEATKENYYESIKVSSVGWHENENDYEPFTKYMLGVVLAAYREFSAQVELLIMAGMSKPERVEKLIQDTPGTVTKTEILKKYPDISQITVQRALADLVSSGKIIKIGGGRYTKYTWNKGERVDDYRRIKE